MSPDNNSRPSIDGIRRPIPPKRPLGPTPKRKPDLTPEHDLPAPEPQPMLPPNDEPRLPARILGKAKKLKLNGPKGRKWIWWLLAAVIVVLFAAAGTAFAWYQGQLGPVTADTTKRIKVTIESGSTPDAIAEQLETVGAIKNHVAFRIYTKLSGTENKLRAGAYSLQPSLSTPAIVDHLVSGKQDTFAVTFLPGDTLANGRQLLIKAGFSEQEVDAALAKQYTGVLFTGKPASADLEGYLYGETLEFDYSATAETVLRKFFDQFEQFVTENDLIAKFKKQGLSLYEGLTLASIVQREVHAKDMPAVARVFLNRMKQGMTLGSDVTYQYAAKKLGVAPNPSLDSPYNTRKYPGLPPGPIATPGNDALLAVANPAHNDYLYFLSGDDDVTYFAKTDEEHEQNKANHCHEKCSIL